MLTECLRWITTSASDDDLARIIDAVNQRRRVNRSLRSAAVSKGVAVEIAEIRPKYLTGLKGVVSAIDKQRCSITLDERSTDVLRFSGGHFLIGKDEKSYLLTGIPLSCCIPIT